MVSSTSLLNLGEDILGILAEKVDEDRTFYRIDEEDRNTQNLCLVSRAFRKPCQRLLFREIHLRNGKYPLVAPLPSLLRLRSVLSGNIHLCRYTRILELSQTFEGDMDDDFIPWMEQDPLLATVLNLFASSPITILRLNSDFHHPMLYWSDIDDQIQTSFTSIFAKPTLRTLELSQVVICSLLLTPNRLPQLENLCLSGSRIEVIQEENLSASVVRRENGALTNVYIDFYTETFWEDYDTPLHEFVAEAGLNFQTVKCLGVKFGEETLPSFSPLLPSLLHLVDLRISFSSLRPDLSERLNLSSLVSLANFSVCNRFRDHLNPSLCWTIDALASIPSSHPSLLSISVGLRFRFNAASMEHQYLIGLLSDELQRLHNRPASGTTSGVRKIALHLRTHHMSLRGLGRSDPAFDAMKEAIAAIFRWGEEGDDTGTRSGEFIMDLVLNQTCDEWVFANSPLDSMRFSL
ncbi:hypothetical protein BDN72DRAFT_892022 [Pluteus cervinus]|uniref:Uncharacterized protein n=1 Tax=Pluteus cervinus TaxID=181527 RepID=A0ACD3BD05_9AGAR|nr:hypothetical protein BDN72DRAFT_892022 [Pluteus cervinus]